MLLLVFLFTIVLWIHYNSFVVSRVPCWRSEPGRAAVWLPGANEPHVELHLQCGEGAGQDVASPGWEFWIKTWWNRRNDRWHAALWPSQYGRIQHPRPASTTRPDRETGCGRGVVPGYSRSTPFWPASNDFFTLCKCLKDPRYHRDNEKKKRFCVSESAVPPAGHRFILV